MKRSGEVPCRLVYTFMKRSTGSETSVGKGLETALVPSQPSPSTIHHPCWRRDWVMVKRMVEKRRAVGVSWNGGTVHNRLTTCTLSCSLLPSPPSTLWTSLGTSRLWPQSDGEVCFCIVFTTGSHRLMLGLHDNKNYNSKREDLEEEDQGEDERNVIL